VDFIDSTGTPVRSWRPFGDDPPDHERILKCSVARGSAAVLWSMPDERGAFAALFSARGELIWDRRLAEVVGGEVQISENESYVLASSYTFRGPPRFATELFGVAGERLAFHPRIFRSACVPESEGNAPPVFVLTDGKVLTHHSADQKTKGVDIWTAPAPDDVITDVTMQPDGTIFALVQKVTAGEDGIQYGQGRLLTTRGPAGAPAIRLIRVPGEGQLSFLRTGDRLQIRSETSATPLPLDAIE
jgi:hypothetical protein